MFSRKGAEADLKLVEGVLVKQRVRKEYRHHTLDSRLRRQRTRREAKNLERAGKIGLNVPKVLDVDEKEYTIRMEYIDGKLVKDVFEKGGEVDSVSESVGVMLRKLHDAKIVHNDLTTSNLILTKEGVYMIDFGLSYHTTRLEDKAMDLVVFKKSIMATHTEIYQRVWDSLLKGYDADQKTLKRIETIEKRVRYS